MSAVLKEVNRQRFIGGSDVPALMGLSPWKTPLELFYEKTDLWPYGPPEIDPKREKIFERGKRLEPVVREMVKEEFGLRVVKISHPDAPNRYTDKQVPYFAAEVDFEAIVTPALHEAWPETADIPVGTRVNCEVKTSHPLAAKKFGEAGTDEVPVEYAAQGMWGLGVTGRQHCLFFVLIGSDTLLPYRIDRDEETLAGMREQAVEFWETHVLPRVPPPPNTMSDLGLLFRKDTATRVVATPEIAEKARQWSELKARAAQLDDDIKTLQFDLGCALLGAERIAEPEKVGKHELMVDGMPLLTVTYFEQRRLDTKRISEELPEIADKYRTVSKGFKYEKPRRKKQ